MDVSVKFESLNTSFVNLTALLRYLREREFVGRIHVALDRYEADVFLYGSGPPRVWETDHAMGRAAQDEGALDRLLVRAREPGGVITVYEGGTEPLPENNAASAGREAATTALNSDTSTDEQAEEVDWDNLLRASGELIAAVERAVQTTGEEFADYLRTARVELGDDYPFLDPSLGQFEYVSATVRLKELPAASAYIVSLTECLKRIVRRLAAEEGDRFRERVAVELAVAARRQENALGEFTPYLDQIAGTRVI